MKLLFEFDTQNNTIGGIIDLLEKEGLLRRVEQPRSGTPVSECRLPQEERPLKIEESDNIPCVSGVNRFLNNHQSIESNIETIAKENLGLCEDRKDWLKDLKAAVKEYSHDQVLESFYNWSIAQGNFIGRKPVTSFLKNIGNNITSTARKPLVTNPLLSRVEERIAYISENRIFFTGDYRVRLATLLKDYGAELVIEAFEVFFQDVEDKGINWASRDFLQRASVMITIIQRKKAEVEIQANLQQAALEAAKNAVQQVQDIEDEDTEL